VAASLIPCGGMSKHFRPWKIDEAQLLPPSVQDYVPKDHLSRLIVTLMRESLDLSGIAGSYRSGLGQPPFDPRMMTALLLHGYASGIYASRRIASTSPGLPSRHVARAISCAASSIQNSGTPMALATAR